MSMASWIQPWLKGASEVQLKGRVFATPEEWWPKAHTVSERDFFLMLETWFPRPVCTEKNWGLFISLCFEGWDGSVYPPEV